MTVEYKKPDTTYPLSRNEVLLKEGAGPSPTPGGDIATDEDIKGITDDIWPSDNAADNP